MSSSAVCVASVDMLLGNLTIMPGAHCGMFVQCALMPMKWLVYPESAIACSLFASRRAVNVYLDIVLENAIVFVAHLCLVVVILSRMFHAAGTAVNVCVDLLFFCQHSLVLVSHFLIAAACTAVITEVATRSAAETSCGSTYAGKEHGVICIPSTAASASTSTSWATLSGG